MSRGTKICPSCSKGTGPRTIQCGACGFVFMPHKLEEQQAKEQAVEQPKKKRGRKPNPINRRGDRVEWTTLQKGDRIKVVGGGPFWLSDSGVRTPLGYRGIYKVQRLDNKGIIAYPVGKKTKEAGHCYIYMGPRAKSPVGCIRKSHRIRKINEVTAEKLYA